MGRVRPPAAAIRNAFEHFRQYRHHQAPRREAVRLVSRTARLAGANQSLSRGRRGAVCRGRREGAGECATHRRRDRHHRHRLLDRHRDAEPGGARRRPDGIPRRRHARAGVRPRLRRRRFGPVDRGAAGAGAARHQRAAGRGRALLAGASARRTHQGQYRRHQPVRRRRRRADPARRRRRRDDGSRIPANICGRIRSASWAGMSIPKALA